MEGGEEGALSSSTDQHYLTVFRFSLSSVGVLFYFKDGGLGSFPAFVCEFSSHSLLDVSVHFGLHRLP